MTAVRALLLLAAFVLSALGAGCLDPRPRPSAPGAAPACPEGEEARAASFATVVRPFVARYCGQCHDSERREAGLALDVLPGPDEARTRRDTWADVVSQLEDGVMPPLDARAHPSAEEVAGVVAWLRAALAAGPPADPGRVTLRRLNRTEYNNTIRDLLGVGLRPADAFPADDTGYGFDTIGDVLTVSPLLAERYLEAAERVAREAIVVYEPIALHVEAEDMARTTRGNVARGFVHLWSAGAVQQAVRLPHEGEYRLRARLYGEQAGPEPVRIAFTVDGRPAATLDVAAVATNVQVYEVTARVAEPGLATVGVAFLNDYYVEGVADRNLCVDWVEVAGPLEPPPLPPSHRRLVTRTPRSDAELRRCAQEVLRPLLRRALRRRVTATEVSRYVELVARGTREGGSFERGVRLGLQAILCSPHFLFKVEVDSPGRAATGPNTPGGAETGPPRTPPGGAGTGPAATPLPPGVQPVSEHELATRLSYFLWASTPDDALLDLADAGRLRAELEPQVRRMLDDPRAYGLVEGFAAQWLGLRRLEAASPDPDTYPAFDEELRAAMRVETEMFFEAVLREDRPVLDLLDARFTFVNARLARHYGLTGVQGERFRRVELPPERGGVLTHASVLTITSNPTRTSPVKRGKWVLEQLLDDPPPPPPPGLDALAPAEHGAAAATLRERMLQHRRDPSCASCHARMDAIGFGLEPFDGVGAWRERDGAQPIDATGELPGGAAFDGPAGLRAALRAQGERVVRAFAKHLLVYGLGRGPTASDEAAIAGLVASLGAECKIQDLIVGLCRLDAFQLRRRSATSR